MNVEGIGHFLKETVLGSTGRTELPMAKGKAAKGKRDRRRKHQHWLVTIIYPDGERFERVYLDRERAKNFAARQKKSPVVKATRTRLMS
jgi:hypothetical protein